MDGQGALEGGSDGNTGAPSLGLHAGERDQRRCMCVSVRERIGHATQCKGAQRIERTTVNELPATITCEAEAALAARNACKRSRSETKRVWLLNPPPL